MEFADCLSFDGIVGYPNSIRVTKSLIFCFIAWSIMDWCHISLHGTEINNS